MVTTLDIGALLLWIADITLGVVFFWSLIYILGPDEKKRKPIHYLYCTTVLAIFAVVGSVVLLYSIVFSGIGLHLSIKSPRVGFGLAQYFLILEIITFSIAAIINFLLGVTMLKHELRVVEKKNKSDAA